MALSREQQLLDLAKEGDSDAQFNLGCLYDDGDESTSINKWKAEEWYRKAAKQGHPVAQNNLAYMYQKAKGVRENFLEAKKWYEAAANQGNSTAQLNLARLYRKGTKGGWIPKDLTKAEEWYLKSAMQGEVSAQYELALLKCEQPNGFNEAARWCRYAAAQGHQKARQKLELLSKTYVGLCYFHWLMLTADAMRLHARVVSDHVIFQEIINDIERSVGDDAQYNNVLSIINELLKIDASWGLRRLQPAQVNIIKKCIFNTMLKHVAVCHANEEQNREFAKLITSWLNAQDIKNANLEEIENLISGIVDAWVILGELNNENEHIDLTEDLSGLLSKILFQLASREEHALIDNRLFHPCALILIRTYYGEQYEVGMAQPTFDQLLLFLTIHRSYPDKAPDEINAIASIELIKHAGFVENHYVDCLNKLSGFLQDNRLASDAYLSLFAIKKRLEASWQPSTVKNKKNAKIVFKEITKAAKDAIKATKRNPDSLFAIKDNNAQYILSLIANKNINDLLVFLNFGDNPPSCYMSANAHKTCV